MIIAADILIKNSHFIIFTTSSKSVTGFLPTDLFLDDVIIFIGQLMHPLFQQIQIFLRQSAVDINIVIETVVDNWADCHFGIWPKLLDSVPQ
ncbi:Uncharacterised protein [Yersinia enterocolitica]|nr:Uncharacterised protein [Yersinia enterocolitica]